jgi:hypothetical protein
MRKIKILERYVLYFTPIRQFDTNGKFTECPSVAQVAIMMI